VSIDDDDDDEEDYNSAQPMVVTLYLGILKPSQVFVRPTDIQALPSPVNFTIIIRK